MEQVAAFATGTVTVASMAILLGDNASMDAARATRVSHADFVKPKESLVLKQVVVQDASEIVNVVLAFAAIVGVRTMKDIHTWHVSNMPPPALCWLVWLGMEQRTQQT